MKALAICVLVGFLILMAICCIVGAVAIAATKRALGVL
jgi:hypothetical protein